MPIAPYLRAAVIGNVYMFTLNGKLDSSGVGKENNPAGLRLGYEFAAGLLFLLDILEPQTAQSARFSGDYQHTYLKAEISYTNINGFSKPGMNFSPKGILGLNWPLMLTFGLVIEV